MKSYEEDVMMAMRQIGSVDQEPKIIMTLMEFQIDLRTYGLIYDVRKYVDEKRGSLEVIICLEDCC